MISNGGFRDRPHIVDFPQCDIYRHRLFIALDMNGHLDPLV